MPRTWCTWRTQIGIGWDTNDYRGVLNVECGVRLVSALELFSFNIPHSTFNDEISSERYFVE